MKHFSFPYLLCLVLFAVPDTQTPLHAAGPSLTVTQTAMYPEKSELRVSARSSVIDGFILVRSPERLPGFSPEVYSFGFAVKPPGGVALYGGAIGAAGLPARARSPVFSLYTPFYTPTSSDSGPVFHTTGTMNTRNAAAEVTLGNTKMAAIAGLAKGSADPSWLLLSQAFPAFDTNDTALTVSVLAATRVQEASADAADSWFLPELPLPETRIFMPGVEILLENDSLSGSCTALLDAGPLVSPAGAIRADGSITVPGFSLAGGFYRSDYRFRDLDDTRNSTLARVFVAPAISIPVGTAPGDELKWGGLIAGDTIRREKYFNHDTSSISGGTGLEFHRRTTRTELHVMKKGAETEVAGSTAIGCFFHPALKLNLRAKTLRTRLTEEIRTENSVSGRLSVNPVRWFGGSLAATGSSTSAHAGMDYSVSLSCGFAVKNPRLDWNLDVKITRQNSGEPLEGSASLKFLLR